VKFDQARHVSAIRLIMASASAGNGLPESDAVPVVRDIEAFRADDHRPILAALWILSVNANPSGQSHRMPGGEIASDMYRASFLQRRLGALASFVADSQLSTASRGTGCLLSAPGRDDAGQVLEVIEGDDPQLDAELLAQSSPPPIVVLSGSNDWDYDGWTGPDPQRRVRWHWDPLRDARRGGMGQLSQAVQERVAPFLGFCGGAQILALLESRPPDALAGQDDQHTIDAVLQRTSGHLIRGVAPLLDVARAWPGDAYPQRTRIAFDADDPLFCDLAGPRRRSATCALPEWHSDAIRPDAFTRGGPLERFDLLATSAFCAQDVVDSTAGSVRDPNRNSRCVTIPEAFRSRDSAWPVIGAQFHPEQRAFADPAPGDPPESVADPRLFLAAAYEQMVDAYERFGP
jgi:hypothetical protein